MNMDVLVSLSKRRGFVFQSSEIYGGTGSCWDYGPLGVELKNNIKRVWWRDFVQTRADMVGIDASILMHPTVWKASGHLAESRAATDRRVRLVTRTAQGDATLIRFAVVMEGLEAQWRDAVGPRRYAAFRGVLGELSAGTAGSAEGSPHG